MQCQLADILSIDSLFLVHFSPSKLAALGLPMIDERLEASPLSRSPTDGAIYNCAASESDPHERGARLLFLRALSWTTKFKGSACCFAKVGESDTLCSQTAHKLEIASVRLPVATVAAR
jgi:hypothetical protein